MEHGIPNISGQETNSSETDYVYMVGQTYHFSNQHWQQAIDYSHEKDLLSHFYSEMPTPKKVKEMKEAISKGSVYQRKEKSSPAK